MDANFKEPILFIISGKARSGKSTIADYIKNYYELINKKCINLMYAESIKNYAKKIINWDGSEETKPRTFLQQLGTEIIRKQIDKNFFINRMIADIKIYSYFFDIIVISDARFIDEIEEPKKHFKNVIVINITNPNLSSQLTKNQLNHSSENALNNYKNYDYTIVNDSSLDELKEKIFNILDKVKINIH